MPRRVLQFNLEAVVGIFDDQGRLKGTQGKRTAVFEADFNRTLAHYATLIATSQESSCPDEYTAPTASERSLTRDTEPADPVGTPDWR